MKALVIPRFGDADVLEIQDRPDPVPAPDEVRVRVRASALNRADLLQRRGRYPAPAGAPQDIPGLEFAGEVDQCGARVTLWKPGDRVMGILGGGGHAEFVVTHERLCAPIPGDLDWEDAAAIPEAFFTAFDALVLQAGLRSGETVLVPAAASGVGTAALQISLAIGARPIGLTRTESKRARLEDEGLGTILDGSAPDIAEQIRAAAPGGVDVVLDLVGASLWELHTAALAPRGRMVLVGTMGGAKVEANLSLLMSKRATVIGTVLRARPIEEKIAVTQAFRRQMSPLFAAGRLHVVVDRVFPLAEAAQAHEAMERNANLGKIVLRV